MCLKYSKEEVCKKELSDEVDVLHVDKESLLQLDFIFFERVCQVCPKYQGKCVILIKKVGNEVRNVIAPAG